ncbi:hypothetical protein [Actinomadura pelletieri]|uniref:hypothetical protein n=1 Tax=Actinomadura pelletieri TaxID=111805 RepID=UPI001B863A8B|nr:hypothetical protein [Actinomadura pelletieri]
MIAALDEARRHGAGTIEPLLPTLMAAVAEDPFALWLSQVKVQNVLSLPWPDRWEVVVFAASVFPRRYRRYDVERSR